MRKIYRVEQYRREVALEFRGWTSEELVKEKCEQIFFTDADGSWEFTDKGEAYDKIESVFGEGRFTDTKVRKGVYRAEVEGYTLTEMILDNDDEVVQSEVIDMSVTPLVMYTTVYSVRGEDGETVLWFEAEEEAEEHSNGAVVGEIELPEQEAKSMIEKTSRFFREQAARVKKMNYNNEYQKQNVKRVIVKLNRNIDADIIAHLEGVGSVQGYIKELIRADMAADQE